MVHKFREKTDQALNFLEHYLSIKNELSAHWKEMTFEDKEVIWNDTELHKKGERILEILSKIKE